MTSELPKVVRPSRLSPVPIVLIIVLTPFISALIAFIWVSLEIWRDPGTFVGDIDTLPEALQIDAHYVGLIVTAVFVIGFMAGIVAAICFSFWRLSGCCDPAKNKTDA